MDSKGAFSVVSQLPAVTVVLAGMLLFTLSVSAAYAEMRADADERSLKDGALRLADQLRRWNRTCPRAFGVFDTAAFPDVTSEDIALALHPEGKYLIIIRGTDGGIVFAWRTPDKGTAEDDRAVVRKAVLVEDGSSRKACVLEVQLWR